MTILYEDNHLLALNKPAGWLVQGDKTGDPTLTDWGKAYIKEKYGKPGAVFLHPVHRIDRPVSGAVLFARTDKAQTRMTLLFREQKIQKTYIALVSRRPPSPSGELQHFLYKDEKNNVSKVTSEQDAARFGAKWSITQYETLGEHLGITQLLVTPRTGRHHQIRAQLASMGCPILGDLKYGADNPLPDASIALHCRNMSFLHPIKQEYLSIDAPFPDVIWYKV